MEDLQGIRATEFRFGFEEPQTVHGFVGNPLHRANADDGDDEMIGTLSTSLASDPSSLSGPDGRSHSAGVTVRVDTEMLSGARSSHRQSQGVLYIGNYCIVRCSLMEVYLA